MESIKRMKAMEREREQVQSVVMNIDEMKATRKKWGG